MAGPAVLGRLARQAGSAGSGMAGWAAWVPARIRATKNECPAASAIAAVTASSSAGGHEANGVPAAGVPGYGSDAGQDAADDLGQGHRIGVVGAVQVDDLAPVPPAAAQMIADVPPGAQQQPDAAPAPLDQRPQQFARPGGRGRRPHPGRRSSRPADGCCRAARPAAAVRPLPSAAGSGSMSSTPAAAARPARTCPVVRFPA